MSEFAIRTEIYNILSGVTNIGKVYDYERWAADWNTFINLFKTTISGADQIRGWEIGRRSVTEGGETLGTNERKHTFTIRGYMGISDAAATEKTFNALIEAICAAFRVNPTLNGSADLHQDVQVEVIEARTFGGVLCHYAEMSLEADEIVLTY